MNFEPTEEQKRIFQFVKDETAHGIIDAVAGAGKTSTIMECAKYVEDRSNVLFCAFNKSIANEISQRFQEQDMNEVTVKTIHALGWQILNSNNKTGNLLTLEDNKYKELLKSSNIQDELLPLYNNILQINGIDPNNLINERQKFAADNMLYKINDRVIEINKKFRSTLAKEDIEDFEGMVIHFGIFNEIEIKKANFKEELKNYFFCNSIILKHGNNLSEKTMKIDFIDMLYLPYIWRLSSSKKFKFLFIDECQDLSKSQFAIALKYCTKDGRILAVGDPQQSIYGFTGADIHSFERVKIYTNAIQLPLTLCFRCPQKVVQLAREIRRDISGSKEEDGLVSTISFDDVIILAKPGDLIISRLKAPLVLLIFLFIDKNIKVQIHEEEVKEIINEIKNIFKPSEINAKIALIDGGFERLRADVKKRWQWIISKNAERIIDGTERNMYVDSENKYLDRKLDFLNKKYEQWKQECPTVLEILKKVKDFISSTDNPIKLSTIHRAKGLENDRVFILNFDALPYYRLEQKDWERTQELNLKYVAITRAKKELYLIESVKQSTLEDEGSLFDNLAF